MNNSFINFPAALFLSLPLLTQAGDLEQLLEKGNCPGCDLKGVNLKHADLREANLAGADLRHALLYKATLQNALFN
ncbi:pentapeptide repeat-containing protein [Solemya velesiana gill symbiont]|nr:pentapeptide repeat-containing protein [Solemya velesiana gill symbiont]